MLDKYNVLRNAEKLVLNQRYNHAIREYEKLLEREPEEPGLLNTVGDLLLKEERSEEAVAVFHRVAEIFTRSGFTVKAIAVYKKIFLIVPHDIEVNEALADLYQKQGLRFEAVRHLGVLADLYEEREQFDRAVMARRSLISLDPSKLEHQLQLGRLLESRGDAAAADVYLTTLRVHLERSQGQEAFELATRALSLAPTKSELLEAYVESAEAGGFLTQAAERLVELRAAAANPYPHQLFLARVRERQGRIDEAHGLYRELVDQGIGDSRILEGLRRTGNEESLQSIFGPKYAGEVERPESFTDFPGEAPQAFDLEEADLFDFGSEGVVSEEANSPPQEYTRVGEPATWEETPWPGIVQEPGIEKVKGFDDDVLAEPPVTTVEPGAAGPPNLEDSLQEVDFYLKLGFREEAEKVVRSLLDQYPEEDRVLSRARKVLHAPRESSAPAPEAREPLLESPETPGVAAALAMTEALEVAGPAENFESEVEVALDRVFTNTGEPPAEVDVLRYDQSGEEPDSEAAGPKTRYDLGLAYQEMGLFEDAVEEFLATLELLEEGADDPQRLLCCSMLTHCYLLLGDHEAAVRWAEEGLRLPAQKDLDRSALQYELAAALEQKGDLKRALKTFQDIAQRDSAYRDIAKRVEDLALRLLDQ